MKDKIILYGAEWCAFCHQARQYLTQLGVAYTYKDVEKDVEDARAAVTKSGQTGIPVIDIDGKIIVGFDRHAIDQTLKDKHLV